MKPTNWDGKERRKKGRSAEVLYAQLRQLQDEWVAAQLKSGDSTRVPQEHATRKAAQATQL